MSRIIIVCIAVLTVFSGCEPADDKKDGDNGNGNSGGGGGSSSKKVPTGVTAVGSSSSSITISWNAVTDANYYKIYRSDNASGTYIEIHSTLYEGKTTSYTNSGLSPGTIFYYKVAANNGEQSNAVSATTN